MNVAARHVAAVVDKPALMDLFPRTASLIHRHTTGPAEEAPAADGEGEHAAEGVAEPWPTALRILESALGEGPGGLAHVRATLGATELLACPPCAMELAQTAAKGNLHAHRAITSSRRLRRKHVDESAEVLLARALSLPVLGPGPRGPVPGPRPWREAPRRPPTRAIRLPPLSTAAVQAEAPVEDVAAEPDIAKHPEVVRDAQKADAVRRLLAAPAEDVPRPSSEAPARPPATDGVESAPEGDGGDVVVFLTEVPEGSADAGGLSALHHVLQEQHAAMLEQGEAAADLDGRIRTLQRRMAALEAEAVRFDTVR